MKTPNSSARVMLSALAGLALVAAAVLAQAAPTDIADVPMAVKNSVKPNVVITYDNSQSMDAEMGGKLIAGDAATTRGNIGRSVLRDSLFANRDKARWGLMTFKTSDVDKTNTFAYYQGSDTTMVFTDDCIAGISATHGGLRCIANPQPFLGAGFVTYTIAGDDANILDVLYTTESSAQFWGIYAGPPLDVFNVNRSHNVNGGWASGDFTSHWFTGAFGFTDAGYIPQSPDVTRILFVPRAWGYIGNVSGKGTLLRPSDNDSDAQYTALQGYLANETGSATGEIKNAAVFTPLPGTLTSARDYFRGALAGSTTPVTNWCQKNFVLLVTDGLPTGKSDGTLYSAAARTNTFDAGTGTWTFGVAANDTINAVTALRSTSVSGFPDPFDVNTYVVALGNNLDNPAAIAVMNALAAAGGTGTAKLATDADAVRTAIDGALNDIFAKTASAAAVAVANAHVTSTENQSFQSSYKSGDWTGDLQSYPIDPATGIQDTTSPLWASSAQVQLDARTPASRYIVSFSGSAPWDGTILVNQGIQFQPASAATATKLSGAQQSLLDTPTSPPGPGDGAAVVAYLRGDRSADGTTYRTRSHVLGDIINAEPVIADRPRASYIDECYSSANVSAGCPLSYKSAQASRDRLILQGGNDGMLHAFDFATGAEKWAYVPNLVMGTLNNLSRKTGFQHKFYVDATGASADVDVCNSKLLSGGSAVSPASCSGPDWRTIFVSGLGKGGRGYFALDITSPTAASEAAAALKVMWEFPHSGTSSADRNNMGYSFGTPIAAKTRAYGWVVLIASGYNNGSDTGGDGHGRLFVLSPLSGEVLAQLDTGVGSAASPSGLAHLSAFAENGDVDATVEQVYGGDLLGNVWRFDLSSASVAAWTVTKLAVLVDAGGVAQPVTTQPELSVINAAGFDRRFVFVGTGKYLGDTDVATTQTQSIYGLVDDLTSTPLISPLRSNLQPQTLGPGLAADERKITSTVAPDYSIQKGWYVDLPASGERVNTNPALARDVLAFTSNIPSSDPCVPGGSSWFNLLDAKTGGVPTYAGITWESKFLGAALASRPVLIQLPSGEIKAIIRKSDVTTTVQSVVPPGAGGGGRRISWREIITQ